MAFEGRITKALGKFTADAEQIAEGNYDFELDYDGDDVVGILARTFKTVTAKLKAYISDLNGHDKLSFEAHISQGDKKRDGNTISNS